LSDLKLIMYVLFLAHFPFVVLRAQLVHVTPRLVTWPLRNRAQQIWNRTGNARSEPDAASSYPPGIRQVNWKPEL